MSNELRQTVERDLDQLGDPARAAHATRFFKAFPGGYGEGDRFFGVQVPVLRRLARGYRGRSPDELFLLLTSPYHEARFVALVLVVEAFRRGDDALRRVLFERYLASTRFIDNWDLVDVSAPTIVGGWLASRDRGVVYSLARSPTLWERRIAMLATFAWIRDGEFDDALALAALLRDDSHDLIHKAVGWMLREVGNRDRARELAFLDAHAPAMPRTMLRYAIEKLPQPIRRTYLRRR